MRELRDKLIQPANPASYSARARARRWRVLAQWFPDLAEMRVLDLGGTPKFWRMAPIHPSHVTMVNLRLAEPPPEPWMHLVVGNACRHRMSRGAFDLVVSNSLLEHVGGADERRRLADVIHTAADRHWVQTPNRYFPIEPHWFFPWFQFLPFRAQVVITQTWPISHRRNRDAAEAARIVREVELIGPGEMRRLFPESEHWIERFFGLPKSLVAIRS